jgi:hypothetical protein
MNNGVKFRSVSLRQKIMVFNLTIVSLSLFMVGKFGSGELGALFNATAGSPSYTITLDADNTDQITFYGTDATGIFRYVELTYLNAYSNYGAHITLGNYMEEYYEDSSDDYCMMYPEECYGATKPPTERVKPIQNKTTYIESYFYQGWMFNGELFPFNGIYEMEIDYSSSSGNIYISTGEVYGSLSSPVAFDGGIPLSFSAPYPKYFSLCTEDTDNGSYASDYTVTINSLTIKYYCV